MGFLKLFANKDTWVTDQAVSTEQSNNLQDKNYGADESLSFFLRKNNTSSGSLEQGRVLLDFDIGALSQSLVDGLVPSTDVEYILNLKDYRHDNTVAGAYRILVLPVSRSWDAGIEVGENGVANWLSASSISTWVTTGSDYHTIFGTGSVDLTGSEDLRVDITPIVNNWLSGNMGRHGLLIKFSDENEASGSDDFYIKKFHSKESKLCDFRPHIEVQWDDVLKDNRGNFLYDVNNKLFFYNFKRDVLQTVTEPVTVTLKDSLLSGSASFSQSYTTTQISTGILTASILIESTASFSSSFYDIWTSGSVALMTGTFLPTFQSASEVDPYTEFDIDIVNLKPIYHIEEHSRFRVNVRKRDFETFRGCLHTASLEVEQEFIEKLYFSVANDETGDVIVPFLTGATPATQLSYNSDGHFFNLAMSTFQPGAKYRFKFLIDINRFDKKYIDQDFTFKVTDGE